MRSVLVATAAAVAALCVLARRHRRRRRLPAGVGPGVSFSHNGTLHAISISFDNDTPRNAVLASRSTNGGMTWSDPAVLPFDNPRALGNNFNDKETITAA